jgi:hypothetical protein
VYVKKDRLLKFVEERIKAVPSPLVCLEEPKPEQEPERQPEPLKIEEPVAEAPKERLCPSCARKAARNDSKYCDA